MKVGDLVHLVSDEPIPVRVACWSPIRHSPQADIVLIATSSPGGDCFIETADLDGFVLSTLVSAR